jgi:hypothetical protein
MSGFGTLKSDADMALVFDPSLNTISKKKSRNVITRLASCLRRQGQSVYSLYHANLIQSSLS